MPTSPVGPVEVLEHEDGRRRVHPLRQPADDLVRLLKPCGVGGVA
jgi:hypothetical protein